MSGKTPLVKPKYKDLTGVRFGKWLVRSFSETTNYGDRVWVVRCECGNDFHIREKILLSGRSVGCIQCLRRDENIKLVGGRFGRLTIVGIDDAKTKKSGVVFICDCDCGKRTKVYGLSRLKAGVVRSCGCYGKDQRLKSVRSHGKTGSSEYVSWCNMRRRCYDPSVESFKHYGGRGITVCDLWRESFENFFADMGNRPKGKLLDRIDNDGNYEPDNCKWSTRREQNYNRRITIKIEWRGETRTIGDWAEITGLSWSRIWSRYYRGMTGKQIFETPFRK